MCQLSYSAHQSTASLYHGIVSGTDTDCNKKRTAHLLKTQARTMLDYPTWAICRRLISLLLPLSPLLSSPCVCSVSLTNTTRVSYGPYLTKSPYGPTISRILNLSVSQNITTASSPHQPRSGTSSDCVENCTSAQKKGKGTGNMRGIMS